MHATHFTTSLSSHLPSALHFIKFVSHFLHLTNLPAVLVSLTAAFAASRPAPKAPRHSPGGFNDELFLR